jgi:threonine dehydrogenase-like Zn-dependent dehydrogenase
LLGAFYHAKNDLKVMETKEPEINDPNEAIVRVRAAGICGTDLKILHGDYGGTPPVILGHEFSGDVYEVGREVTNVRPGDRVVIDPNLTCGSCYFCLMSQENLCVDMKTTGLNRNGGFAEYCAVHSRTMLRVPDTLPHSEAALAEPLACVLNGFNRSRISAGDSVGIVGLGPIGLLYARVMEHAGVSKVVTFEVNPERAAMAEKLGIEIVIDPTRKGWLKRAMELTDGRGVDVAIDAAGSAAASQTALEIVRRGGRVNMFGIPRPGSKLEVDATRLVTSELEIKGSFIDRFTFLPAVTLLSERFIDVRPLITHSLPLSEARDAFSLVERGAGIKVELNP